MRERHDYASSSVQAVIVLATGIALASTHSFELMGYVFAGLQLVAVLARSALRAGSALRAHAAAAKSSRAVAPSA